VHPNLYLTKLMPPAKKGKQSSSKNVGKAHSIRLGVAKENSSHGKHAAALLDAPISSTCVPSRYLLKTFLILAL